MVRRKENNRRWGFWVNRILLCFEFWPVLLRCGWQTVAGLWFITVPLEITSIGLDDWLKLPECWREIIWLNTPANTNAIQRERLKKFGHLHFGCPGNIADELPWQFDGFIFLGISATHLVSENILWLIDIQVLSWDESHQSLKSDLSSWWVLMRPDRTHLLLIVKATCVEEMMARCSGPDYTGVTLAVRRNLKTGPNISWYLENILYSYISYF